MISRMACQRRLTVYPKAMAWKVPRGRLHGLYIKPYPKTIFGSRARQAMLRLAVSCRTWQLKQVYMV